MRQISSFLALSATIAYGANASGASIFTFDDSYHQWHSTEDPTLTEHSARLVLEHRMKSPDVSSLGGADQETVELLNQIGGAQSPLFGAPNGVKTNPQKNVLVIEGVGPELSTSIRGSQAGGLSIQNPSANFLDDDFLASLSETTSILGTQPAKFCTSQADTDSLKAAQRCLDKSPNFQNLPQLYSKTLLDHVDFLESWVDESSSGGSLKITLKSPDVASAASVTETLKALFHDISILSSKNQQFTAIILPQQQSSNSGQTLRARGMSTSGRRESHVLSTSNQKKSIPSTFIPVCHASESSCTEATNNCSGNGHCFQKSGSEGEGASKCYACKCQETVIKKEDGTVQKVRWGGSACQKRDISSPFFLIAGISIMAVVAVSTAVGMLFSIGQDELPGVISAGVGAPRAPK